MLPGSTLPSVSTTNRATTVPSMPALASCVGYCGVAPARGTTSRSTVWARIGAAPVASPAGVPEAPLTALATAPGACHAAPNDAVSSGIVMGTTVRSTATSTLGTSSGATGGASRMDPGGGSTCRTLADAGTASCSGFTKTRASSGGGGGVGRGADMPVATTVVPMT
jgi:hypothetical protein